MVACTPSYATKGVCVFDYDFTLACDGAFAAVHACKRKGMKLAINTARDKHRANEILDGFLLIEKGFDLDFLLNARRQVGLNGAFQYKEDFKLGQPLEQIMQNKSYGMRNIANHYGIKTDGIESKKLILFDDLWSNILQVEKLGAFDNLEWKIYRGKWVGYFCTRWNDPANAYMDAMEVIEGLDNVD